MTHDAQARIAADWLTIWQSEAAALATDRELHEVWQRLVSSLAQHGAALIKASLDDSSGRAGAALPAGSASAGAASAAMESGPDKRDDVIADLQRRIAALERRDS